MMDMKRFLIATDNLIEQQFYKAGADTIVGRTPEISVRIKNSGLVIKRFKTLFYNNISFFLEKKYRNFFTPFKEIKGMDDNYIQETLQDIQIKLATMQGTELDDLILYTIVLSSLISKMRNIHFKESVEQIVKKVKLRNTEVTRNEVKKQLDMLFMRNNKNVSILYNLSYMDALAESFNFKKVAQTCKIQKGRFMNKTVELILKGLEKRESLSRSY
ncbi:MAG: hypothetical protein EU517_01120 [Promethearchaeota archaeon]|nr:MAG: hypothetical protein EU517_01120 [Candidatus Lokiarchaeota archaeon]